MPGNDGRTLILVPDDIEVVRTPVRPDEQPGAHAADRTEEIARANARAERAEVGRRTAEQWADEANKRADVALALADRTLVQLAEVEKQVETERLRTEQVIAGERARADGLRDQLEVMRVQLATSEAEAKAARDRACMSGEQQSAAERRADAERARADRMEAQAAHEREDLLDAEARARRELEIVRERVAEAEAHQDRLRAEVDSVRAEFAAARRTEDERKGRGRWSRLRAAWRGE
jgi:hypothetical protein